VPVVMLQAPLIFPKFELQALQEAVDPPPEPAQVQTQETPDEETTEFAPTEQRFVAGAEAKIPPLEEPQAPLVLQAGLAASPGQPPPKL